jgi:nucleoside-diphosphate-sugar epimerase
VVNTGEVVLVTGGAGFIGSQLCRLLLQRGMEVYAVDNFLTGRRENLRTLLPSKRFHFHELDIADPAFRERFLPIPFRKIYHLACPTGVPNIQRYAVEMLMTCSLGTLHVLDLARAHQSSLLFTSSCEAYGEPLVFPQAEHYPGNVDPVGPRSPYEEGKRFAECILVTAARQEDLPIKVVRIFNTFGPGMSPDDLRVIPRFFRQVFDSRPLTIYGDGMQRRTFLYISDLLQGLLLVMEQGLPGEIYNIGSVVEVTVRELASLILELTGSGVDLLSLPHFTIDHSRRLPSLEKIQKLGWEPKVSLREGLERMLMAIERQWGKALTPTVAVRRVGS